ncbi:MAG: non-homologous end-joining DNA ligase [Gammaproteobacteria bacterium]
MTTNDALSVLSKVEREKLREKSQPKWVEPMLAKLTDERFSDEDWIFERKFDGVRCLAHRDGDKVRLFSRNRQPQNDTYPELVEALERQGPESFVADGEIVAFRGKVTSFSRLQGRLGLSDPDEARASGIAVYYYLFDLPYYADHDLEKLPLRARKRVLRKAFSYTDPLRYSRHRNTEGESYHREACRKGWEGIIAKRAEGAYAGKRSRDWLKMKCVHRQELVIGGYTDPESSRSGFGALLLGYYEGNRLCFAGRVGTGFDEEELRNLLRRLKSRERRTPAFDAEGIPRRHVHWVRPDLVAEIGFTEWTDDGKLRHPRYLGLRHDKDARDVVREDKQ